MTNNNKFNVDTLLNSLFRSEPLSELFENRVKELKISSTQALEVMGIEYRPLQAILHGTKKQIDIINFIKLAGFLKVKKELVIDLYLESLQKNYPEDVFYHHSKIDFINENFDLAPLVKSGFIKNTSDYKVLEEKIKLRFGLSSILEYKRSFTCAAFSAGTIQPKDPLTRELWIESAIIAFQEISNSFEYSRQRLLEYFPTIREQTTDVDSGLFNVIKALFRLGVTVYYQPSLSTVHLRGATLLVNNKPCIVITDYRGFYSTIWFALVHELYHVLFDLDEIKNGTYHISEMDTESMKPVSEKENEANNFAREYLLPKEKMDQLRPHINNHVYIKKFARLNNIHPSFIYTFHAHDAGSGSSKDWATAKRHNPNFDHLTSQLALDWSDSTSTKDHIEKLKDFKIYN